MCCDSSTQLVSRVERETVNGMYLGHSFRLEYLHFGTGDLEKTEMNKRTVDSKPRQSKYGVCCNASNATSTEPESVRRTVMACTKGTPSGECTYIPEMIALIS